jgi:hypothetical protein
MNLTDVNRIHNDAPEKGEKNSGFSLILELTIEEKRELLNLWNARHQHSILPELSNISIL